MGGVRPRGPVALPPQRDTLLTCGSKSDTGEVIAALAEQYMPDDED